MNQDSRSKMFRKDIQFNKVKKYYGLICKYFNINLCFRYEVKIEEMTKKLQRLEEKHMFDRSTLDHSGTELQATVHNLTEKLRKSEESNKNLEIYIDHLKKSYHNVFGEKTQSSPSLVHSQSADK